MRKPNFFILGAPKCGTTALHAHLAQHPEIFMATPKETWFFALEFEKGMDYYWQRYFGSWQNQQSVGEASAIYLSLPFVAERIAQTCPSARLLVMLRDPVARAYSAWWMQHARGKDPLGFEDAIAENLERLEAGLDFQGARGRYLWVREMERRRGAGLVTMRPYIDGGYFDEHLSEYFSRFDRDRFHIGFLRDLKHDTTGTVAAAVDFLGLSPSAETGRIPRGDRNEALGPLGSAVYRAATRMGVRAAIPAFIRSWAKGLAGSSRARPAMKPDTKRMLVEHFRPHVQRLGEILDRPDIADALGFPSEQDRSG